MKRPLITAHTGCMNTPLNSIQSVIEGLKAGADMIEVDVRVTKDGVAVLLHDEYIYTSKGSQKIQDLTYEELMVFTKNEQILRLEEILPLIKENHRSIILDLKEEKAIDPMIKTIEKYNMRDYSIIGGCGKQSAVLIKEHYRPYQVLLNASVRLLEACKGDYQSFYKETCHDAITSSCCGINSNYLFCSEELIDYATLRCLPVFVWTVDETSLIEKFLNMGVHSITTNEVQTLVRLRT